MKKSILCFGLTLDSVQILDRVFRLSERLLQKVMSPNVINHNQLQPVLMWNAPLQSIILIIITPLFHTIVVNPQLHNKLSRRTAQIQLNTKNQL